MLQDLSDLRIKLFLDLEILPEKADEYLHDM